jgi:protein arginine N-methyltransferase 1
VWVRSSPTIARLYFRYFGHTKTRRLFSGISGLKMHEKMVADSVRNEVYHRAIIKHVGPDDVVVDLGTGTGLLAFFAASKSPRKIYAIDHSDILPVTRQIAEMNGIRGVEFIRTNSRTFQPSEPVDIIIHEQMSYDLFSHDMIANVVDLRKRVLKPGGLILPGYFDVYIEPVMLKDEYRLPFLWEQDVFGVRYDALRPVMEEKIGKTYHRRNIRIGEIDRILSRPEKIFSVDLHTMDEGDLPKTVKLRRTVTEDGRMDGFAMYFTARFDDEISFGTSPTDRRTRWAVLLFRTPAKEYHRGDSVSFEASSVPINAPRDWDWHYA